MTGKPELIFSVTLNRQGLVTVSNPITTGKRCDYSSPNLCNLNRSAMAASTQMTRQNKELLTNNYRGTSLLWLAYPFLFRPLVFHLKGSSTMKTTCKSCVRGYKTKKQKPNTIVKANTTSLEVFARHRNIAMRSLTGGDPKTLRRKHFEDMCWCRLYAGTEN